MNIPFYIEVETSSYCNRVCSWCQNSVSNRGKMKKHIEESTWLKLLEELYLIEYSGRFAFHNYNEPLADFTIFDKIQQARMFMPNAKLSLYSNGDKLNRKILKKLVSLGLDELRITLYPKNKKEELQASLQQLSVFCKKIDLDIHEKDIYTNSKRYEARFFIEPLFLRVISPNIFEFNDRAGELDKSYLLSTQSRTLPCHRPVHSASIDYLGNLKLCCQVYDTSDIKNETYIIGNLKNTSLIDLWNSDKMLAIREKVISANFNDLSICQNCTATETGDIINPNRFNKNEIMKYKITFD